MNEGRKLTLRNHAELFASDLSDIENALGGILLEIDSKTDEFIDDDIYTNMRNFHNTICEALGMAWDLENLCQEREMGKRRF